jgi:hypothetical protein
VDNTIPWIIRRFAHGSILLAIHPRGLPAHRDNASGHGLYTAGRDSDSARVVEQLRLGTGAWLNRRRISAQQLGFIIRKCSIEHSLRGLPRAYRKPMQSLNNVFVEG